MRGERGEIPVWPSPLVMKMVRDMRDEIEMENQEREKERDRVMKIRLRGVREASAK